MGEEKKVSKFYFTIITTCYNRADTLVDTMESVFNQTFKDFEYIVMDANSTDGTIELLRDYSEKFEGKMKYYSGPDKGMYDAINKAISCAEGKYISILNSDDYYSHTTLEKVYRCSKNSEKPMIVYGDIMRVTKDKIPIYRHYFSYSRIENKIPFGHPSMFVPKIVYDKEGTYDLRYFAADAYFQEKLYQNRDLYEWYISNEIFTFMREGGASDDKKNRKKRLNEIVDIDVRFRNKNYLISKVKAYLGDYARRVKGKLPYKIQKKLYCMYRQEQINEKI